MKTVKTRTAFSRAHISGKAVDTIKFSLFLSLSVLTAIFPGEPGLAGFIEQRTMEVVVTTEAIRRAQLQSNRHHQQTSTQLFTDQMPFLSPKPTVSNH